MKVREEERENSISYKLIMVINLFPRLKFEQWSSFTKGQTIICFPWKCFKDIISLKTLKVKENVQIQLLVCFLHFHDFQIFFQRCALFESFGSLEVFS